MLRVVTTKLSLQRLIRSDFKRAGQGSIGFEIHKKILFKFRKIETSGL